MSETGASPSQPGPPSRRRRWLRRGLWLLGTTLVLLFVLHSPPAKRLMASLLARAAGSALGGDVRLSRLDYRLWAGEVSVEGVEVRAPGLEIDCVGAEVVFGLRSGARVSVDSPRVVVIEGPAGTREPQASSGPSRPWAFLGRLAAVDLEDGALEIRRGDGTPWMRLKGIGAQLSRVGENPRGAARIEDAAVGWPEAGIRLEGLGATAEVELDAGTGTLRLLSGSVASEDATLEGRGELRQTGPILATAEGGGTIDAGLLRRLVPDLQLVGRLEAQVSFEQDRAGARGSLEVEIAGLEAWEIGPWSGSLRGTLRDRRLEVDSLSLAGYEGRAEAKGALFLGDGLAAMDVQASGLDLSSLVATFVDPPPPLASRVDAELRLELQDWDLDTLQGWGRASFRAGEGEGWPVTGPLTVGLADRRVSWASDELRVRTAEVATDGTLSFAKEMELRYALLLPHLDVAPELLADAGVDLPALALAGALEVGGELAGRLPDWQATARVSSERLSVEDLDVEIEGLLAVSKKGVEIESLEAAGADGRMTARGYVPLSPELPWSVEAEVGELRLTDALALHGVPVPTTARGRLQVEGPGPDPTARFEVEARAEPVGGPEGGGDDVPEREAASLRLVGSLNGREGAVDELAVDLGGGSVKGSASWSRAGGALVGTARVAGVELARLPWLPGPAALADLRATLSGKADLSGRLEAPEGRLALLLGNPRYREQAFGTLALEATLDGGRARIEGRLGEEPLLSGHLPFEAPWPLHLDLDLGALPLTGIVGALTGPGRVERSLDFAGVASLDLPLRDPAQVAYEAHVDSLEMGLGGPGIAAGAFTVRGTGEAVAIEGLVLRRGGAGQGRLEVDGTLGLSPSSDTDTSSFLTVSGDVDLADLAAFLPDTELTGTAAVDVQIGGWVAAPDITGTLGVAGEAGRVGPLALGAMALEATAREGVLTVEQARLVVAGGEVSARGDVPLGPRASGIHTLELRLQGVDPGALLETKPGLPRLVAPLDLSGRLHISALAPDAIEGEGEITGWSVDAGPETLALVEPARWRYEGGRLTLDDLRLRGSRGHLGASGIWAPGETLRFNLTGDTDLALLNPLLGGDLLLSGPGRVDLTVQGPPGDLDLEGGASLEDARAVLRQPPVVVSHLSGSLEARGRGLEIDARGTVGDGSLRVNGRVGLALTGPEVDVTLDADRVPLAFPEGLRSRSSGTVRLSGGERRYRVAGDLTVHRAVYDRETDFTNQSLDSLGAELRSLEERGSLLERVQLDVRVRLAEGLRIQNRQAEVVLDGAVTLGGDLLTPELQGSVSLRDGGTLRLSRATIRLVDGRINLAGFPSRPLEVDISGRTQVTGIQIEVDLSGPLDDLRTGLSSPNRSDLTQADLATLLLTGRTAQAAADESGAIVAEEVAAALGSALNDRLGGAVLIDVSRDESLIVQDTDPTQRFNVGIPLGERLYVIYSQALDRSGTRWILDFRPRGSFRVRLISDSDDTGAIEVSHGLSFDLWSRDREARPQEHEPPRVRQVRVEGLAEADAAELEKKGKLEPGDRYDFFQGDASARRMREHLVQQGYQTALVEASEQLADEGRVDVVFRVERGPRVEVEWVGDDPGRKLRKRLGEGWDAYLSLEETASRRARDLRSELRARRYYQATVSAEVEESGTEAKVVFDVQRGPRGSGVDLDFEGSDALPPEALAAVLPPRKEAAFFALLEPGGGSDLDTALRTAGARAGFLSLGVGTPGEVFDPATGRLRVTLPIDEGERVTLVSLEIPEEAASLAGAAAPELELQVGEPFRIDAYVNDRGTLASWFRAQGFPEARLAGILDPVPGGMAVRFEVDTGPRPRVGEIREGQEGIVRPGVVEGAVTLGPGDLIRPGELARSRDHLSETRVFRSVDVRAEATADAGVRDLVVDLAKRPDLSVEYKVRYETGRTRGDSVEPETEESRGFQFGAGIEAANPFGRAHRYSLYGLAGKRRQLLGSTFEAQTFFGRRWRTQVFVYDDNEKDYDTTSVTRRVSSVAFQQTKRWRSGLTGRRWHDRLRLLWGYAYRRIDYIEPTTGETLAGNRAGLATSLVGDTRDSVTDPHRGFFWTVSADPALEVLGSDKSYWKLYGQVFAYVPLGSKVVWAQGLRIGAAPGDDPLLLLDRRFKAGGATTLRGFAENSLGPTYQGIRVGGQGLFVFNQELRFPIWDRVHAGVFFDAGNVWELAGEIALGDLRGNVGAGLRVIFPFGPIRLDWAWVLDPREGEQRSRWQFALGHAF